MCVCSQDQSHQHHPPCHHHDISVHIILHIVAGIYIKQSIPPGWQNKTRHVLIPLLTKASLSSLTKVLLCFSCQAFQPVSSNNQSSNPPTHITDMGVSKNRGTQKWMVYNGKLTKIDDLGVPLFSETSTSCSFIVFWEIRVGVNQQHHPIKVQVQWSTSCQYSYTTKTQMPGWNNNHQMYLPSKMAIFQPVISHDSFSGSLPSRELTYPTLGKGKSSSKCHFLGIC